MRKIFIITFIIFQVPNISFSQGIENVDKLLGYKEFKFGMKIEKVDTCFEKSQPIFGVKPKEDYVTSDPRYNKFLENNSNMFFLYLDKGILYKVEFWFRDEHFTASKLIGTQAKVDRIWRDLVKLFGEPNKPVEQTDDIMGGFKTYIWEGKKNVIEFQLFKEGENLNLLIYDKKLNNDYKLSQFR